MQHFGPERLEIKPIYCDLHGDNGFESELVGYSVRIELTEHDKPIVKAMEFFCAPASPNFVDGKVAQMRVVMARRAESMEDITLLIATFSVHLCKFPPDIISSTVDWFITTKTFFPALSDIMKVSNERFAFRRAILEAMKTPRNDLLTGSDLPNILRKSGISESEARLWFKDCRIQGDALIAPSSFVRDWIETRFGHRLPSFKVIFDRA